MTSTSMPTSATIRGIGLIQHDWMAGASIPPDRCEVFAGAGSISRWQVPPRNWIRGTTQPLRLLESWISGCPVKGDSSARWDRH